MKLITTKETINHRYNFFGFDITLSVIAEKYDALQTCNTMICISKINNHKTMCTWSDNVYRIKNCIYSTIKYNPDIIKELIEPLGIIILDDNNIITVKEISNKSISISSSMYSIHISELNGILSIKQMPVI